MNSMQSLHMNYNYIQQPFFPDFQNNNQGLISEKHHERFVKLLKCLSFYIFILTGTITVW